MKTIEVSDETYNFLMDLSKELTTQNHRGTAMPYFFQIKTQEEVAVPEGCGTECWVSDGSRIETEEEINDTIFDYREEKIPLEKIKVMSRSLKEEILKEAGWREANYDYKDKFENSFLTEKSCKEHIKVNGYHYNEPVDYLTHAYRNPEMESLIKFICELTGVEAHT